MDIHETNLIYVDFTWKTRPKPIAIWYVQVDEKGIQRDLEGDQVDSDTKPGQISLFWKTWQKCK